MFLEEVDWGSWLFSGRNNALDDPNIDTVEGIDNKMKKNSIQSILTRIIDINFCTLCFILNLFGSETNSSAF